MPPNDDLDAATIVMTLPFIDAVNTVDATTASGDPGACRANNSVWYRLTPDPDVTVNITAAGSSYDAILGVFTGTRGGPADGGLFAPARP